METKRRGSAYQEGRNSSEVGIDFEAMKLYEFRRNREKSSMEEIYKMIISGDPNLENITEMNKKFFLQDD